MGLHYLQRNGIVQRNAIGERGLGLPRDATANIDSGGF
jgi:hypothetical protein